MDAVIDRQIPEHMLRICICIVLWSMEVCTRLDESSRHDAEGSSVFVKYNRMIHGRKSDRGRKRDTLTIKFLKKYIHYAKNRIQPELTDEIMHEKGSLMIFRDTNIVYFM
ncbi:hypothetical protein OROMI_003173 [Orobanche minor]